MPVASGVFRGRQRDVMQAADRSSSPASGLMEGQARQGERQGPGLPLHWLTPGALKAALPLPEPQTWCPLEISETPPP